jgi:hypothetical protein
LDDETLGGAVTSSLARFEEVGGFIRACPAFTPRTAKGNHALKHVCPARKKELLALRRELYCGGYVCDTLNDRLLDEGDSFTAAQVPVICRLSTLPFCNYGTNGELVWNGKTYSESSHRTYDTARRDIVHPTGVRIHRILYLMHSSRAEHDKLIGAVGNPMVLCGLHGLASNSFGTVLQRGQGTQNLEVPCAAVLPGGVVLRKHRPSEAVKERGLQVRIGGWGLG